MKLQRSISEPPRQSLTWDERWNGPDDGLIACWERGREKANESPDVAAQCSAGRLLVLPWRGGIEKAIKGKKFGTFEYLSMWQGLRNEDLNIDTDIEPEMVCSLTGQRVTFTSDRNKYAESDESLEHPR